MLAKTKEVLYSALIKLDLSSVFSHIEYGDWYKNKKIMYEKKSTIILNKFPTLNSTMLPKTTRVKILPDSRILLISNDESKFYFLFFDNNIQTDSFSIDYSYGQLLSVTPFNGDLWLEFRFVSAPYDEEYLIVRANSSRTDIIASFPRENYSHDHQYHHLFINNGILFLHLIRHNRLHHYKITNMAEEIDVMEGGKWYLCGSYPVCMGGRTLELYDPSLNLCNTVEYDYETDELLYANSNTHDFFAATFTDLPQEHTTLFIYHNDNQTANIAYIEHAVADMGVSAGRVWLNPYSFQIQQDMGGCMVFDRFALPLYIHMRAKGAGTASVGTFPPPFHRSEGIYQMTDGMTLVAESNRLLIFDYNCRAVQEISLSHPDCFAVSGDGCKIAILNIDRSQYKLDEVIMHLNISLEIYQWDVNADGGKVIEMLNFQR
ncbi:MAG: hypothetical protein LBH05_09230 [Deferribacteraceae bacterium]|nr:hypothetical protein [Deferribacteraceae bacterium]